MSEVRAKAEAARKASRKMWLPVMDYTNKSIENPTSRDVSDARMRCLVKTLSLFGLALDLYFGEELEKNYDTWPEKLAKLKGSERRALWETADVISAAKVDDNESAAIEAGVHV